MKYKEDYEKAEKYYLMAIEKGDSDAMNNLIKYYEKSKKDFKIFELYLKYPNLIKREKIILEN